jgi:hypothetical protein
MQAPLNSAGLQDSKLGRPLAFMAQDFSTCPALN